MGVLSPRRYKISIVSYTNTLPFKWALKNSSLIHEIDLREDIPSDCAQKLRRGEVDLALVPVALIPDLPEHHVAGDYCIGATGKVDSVKLYSEVPLKDISRIVLDYQSRSSINLTRVLSRFYWEISPEFTAGSAGFEKEIKGSQAAVVIGDRTFGLNGKFLYEYDLAEEWKHFTKLPFVFAAWISIKKLPPGFVSQFNDVLAHGVKNITLAIEQSETPAALNKIQLKEYLTERIDYFLDEDKKTALQMFLKFMGQL